MNLGDIRKDYSIEIPTGLKTLKNTSFEKKEASTSVSDQEELKKLFPHIFGAHFLQCIEKSGDSSPLRVGVVLSGGQAAGGHNVISGIFDALKELNPNSTLYGFLNGPIGVIEGEFIELEKELIDSYRNQGGFDMIGSGRDKIESVAQLESSFNHLKEFDGLVVIGGDDSNTNAAVLANYLLDKGAKTRVIGVPKTIDGDLKNEHIEVSFGFDTASKTYSELIGNIARDAVSAKKYTHFVKLMGRSASHIALECALATQPNLVLIGEEVKSKKLTLQDITNQIADLIENRSKARKNYGVILIPEGLIEFIPEMESLIQELNRAVSAGKGVSALSAEAQITFTSLPEKIQNQLLMDRDPHGNVQVSHIQTEALFIETVKKELKKRGFTGKFSPVSHFFGYEGRAALPTNFDATYCYNLGRVAALLVQSKMTGYMSSLQHLTKNSKDWVPKGIPLTSMMNLEERKGKIKPVIKKALVDLDAKDFKEFANKRSDWEIEDKYLFPGPIQFFGAKEITDTFPKTMNS